MTTQLNQLNIPAMDSFTDISAYTSVETATPTNAENGGNGSTNYCVVFAKEDLPTDAENGGNGSTNYCVVA
ncbi:hypothetical protein H0H81_010990 [Sphagnurus paluster]|uniref:Uncharacterized protein n=1 Tax=Sphagnurus paluster TaxID=117069 RepID=A0A9P7GSG6_9AGAR|nr:hypothetical protein H0H81_010990 [Sphagnurus paluster]